MSNYKQYLEQRSSLIQQNLDRVYEGLTFSEYEEKVNQKYINSLKKHRKNTPHTFYFPNTLKYIDQINQTDIFKVLKKMPKGVIHHLHGDCAIDIRKFLDILLLNEHAYFSEQAQKFKYFKTKEQASSQGFVSTRDLYLNTTNKSELDDKFRRVFTITVEDTANYDVDIWQTFEQKILSTGDLIYQKDIYRQYLQWVMEDFIADGLLRIEARMFLGFIFDENGQPISTDELMSIVQSALDAARKIEPLFDFVFIVQGLKVWNSQETLNYLRVAFDARKRYPHFIVGFDMVQEEDRWKFLDEIAETLIQIDNLEKEYGIDMPLFLHAGETLNSIENKNLYDALLLKSKRVGHGLGLAQHALLMEEYRKEKIGIEVCPVSNQLLRYYNDIRLHPLKTFLNFGLRVTISPDDPHLFGVTGVTYDYFYASFGTLLDLKDLKKLVKNTVDGAEVDQQTKEKLWSKTLAQWEDFLKYADSILE